MSSKHWINKRNYLYGQLIKGADALRTLYELYTNHPSDWYERSQYLSKELTANQQEKLDVIKIELLCRQEAVSSFVSKYNNDPKQAYEALLGFKAPENISMEIVPYTITFILNKEGFNYTMENLGKEMGTHVGGLHINRKLKIPHRGDGSYEDKSIQYELKDAVNFVIRRPHTIIGDREIDETSNIVKHEQSHAFGNLISPFPESPEHVIRETRIPQIYELKRNLKEEEIAYLLSGTFGVKQFIGLHFTDTRFYDLYDVKNKNFGELVQKMLDKHIEFAREHFAKERELKKDGNIDKQERDTVEHLRNRFSNLVKVRKKNQEAVDEAYFHMSPKNLAWILRNIEFDKIHKRLPGVLKRYLEP